MTTFIIDDDPLFRKRLAGKLLEAGIKKVHSFDFMSDAFQAANKSPDLIIINHLVQGLESLKTIALFRERLSEVIIFYISESQQVEILAMAKQLGADRFFFKDKTVDENIINALGDFSNPTQKKDKKFLQFFRKKHQINSRPLVFVLDDDKLFSAFIRHKLSKFSVLDLAFFERAEELYEASSQEPDLLFLDFHLPNITGDQIFDKFKKLSPRTKVVMFTSQQDLRTAMHLFDAGIADYIVKNKEWEKNLRMVLEKQLQLTLSSD